MLGFDEALPFSFEISFLPFLTRQCYWRGVRQRIDNLFRLKFRKPEIWYHE